jgi:hypothetical protein
MTTQRSVRASDNDRDSVAGMLCDAYAAGCLDRGELEQRSGLAYRARTAGELQDLTADLPAWLLQRPVPLPDEYRPGRPPSCPRELRAGLVSAVVACWLIVSAAAWAPLLAIPLALAVMCLLLTLRARGWSPRSPHRPRSRVRHPGQRR